MTEKPNIIKFFETLQFEKITIEIDNGEEFEQFIFNTLIKVGFKEKKKEDDKKLNTYIMEKIKKDINKPIYKNLKNTYKEHNFFVYQPYGSQKHPDFLVFTKRKIYCIECKSSKQSNTPMWNSNLPNGDNIYLFLLHKNNKNELTFFLGKDVLSDKEVITMKKQSEENKNHSESKNENSKSRIKIYYRETYQDTSKKEDYFNDTNLENVIKFIKKQEKISD